MVSVDIVGQDLNVSITGWDVVWSLRRSLTVPLANVVDARVESVAGKPGWKIAGTGIPWGFSAGWFRRQGKNEFWVAHQSAEVVAITLRNERYTRLVLEVADPQAVADRINQAIGQSS